MTYLIRRARVGEDLDIIEAMQAALFMEHRADTASGYWWLVWCDGKPVAFAGMEHSRYYQQTGYMNSAAVAWEHRGNGLQKRLIRRRIARARELGWKWLLTDTSPDNYPSANSLIGCGFKLFKPWYKWGSRGSIYLSRKL
ncbi:MAG: GNAT family N-acetyltransferase [Nitrospiraceae bacterium]